MKVILRFMYYDIYVNKGDDLTSTATAERGKKMKRFFMMDIYGVDRMTKEAKDAKTATTFFGICSDIIPTLSRKLTTRAALSVL